MYIPAFHGSLRLLLTLTDRTQKVKDAIRGQKEKDFTQFESEVGSPILRYMPTVQDTWSNTQAEQAAEKDVDANLRKIDSLAGRRKFALRGS